jgi:heme oxygenase
MQSSDSGPAVEFPAIEPAHDSAIGTGSARGAPRSLRQTLRAATSESHARLHLHAGFAAIQSGTIDLIDYRALLVRLYGFHLSFETAVGIENERSAWLRDDLAALGVGGHTLATVPRCTALAAFDTPGRRLGALYVVEGSTLGGRHLARNLETLVGLAGRAGRCFFLGRGEDTDAAWHAFLARLAISASAPLVAAQIVAAAVATFSIFEEWLHGWRSFAE